MSTANIKKSAFKARNAFIAAMTRQAARHGVTARTAETLEIPLGGKNARWSHNATGYSPVHLPIAIRVTLDATRQMPKI